MFGSIGSLLGFGGKSIVVAIGIGVTRLSVEKMDIGGGKSMSLDADHWMNRGGTSDQRVIFGGEESLCKIYGVSKFEKFDQPFLFKDIGVNDTIAFNTHGCVSLLDDYSASQFLASMRMRGFKGCKEIHLWACDVGKGSDCFAQSLTDAIQKEFKIEVPVCAPAGILQRSVDGKFSVVGFPIDQGWTWFYPSTKGISSSNYVGAAKSPPPKS